MRSIALLRKALAALASRRAVSRKSTNWPSASMARHTLPGNGHRHFPPPRMQVSSFAQQAITN